jgi:hypothetical protein
MDISTYIVVIVLTLLFFGFPVWANLHSRRKSVAENRSQPKQDLTLHRSDGAR